MGVPSVFVRASGCNLRCSWCDTPYASWTPTGSQQTVEQIVEQVLSYNCRHVVVTGGEPVIMPDIEDLCAALKRHDLHITLETAATVYKPLAIDLASLSPKLSNSTPSEERLAVLHERLRLNASVIQRFIDTSPDRQLKFVVASPDDMGEIDDLLSQLKGWQPADVLLMPEGIDVEVLSERSEWLVDICKQRGFRFCPRLHVLLYGHRAGV